MSDLQHVSVRPELVEGHLSANRSPVAGLAFDKLRPNGNLVQEVLA